MLKQLVLTIPPSIWEDYKKALSKKLAVQVDDIQAQSSADIDMFHGLMKTIYATEQPKCGNCDGDLCDDCGECHDTQCYEYETDCKEKGKNDMDERELIKKMWDVSIEGTYQDDLLKEAIELLKMWRELPYPSTGLINSYHTAKKRMLDERTARFLEKEGKNE